MVITPFIAGRGLPCKYGFLVFLRQKLHMQHSVISWLFLTSLGEKPARKCDLKTGS